MKVGDKVLYKERNGIIYRVHHETHSKSYYDVILSERNVPLENISKLNHDAEIKIRGNSAPTEDIRPKTIIKRKNTKYLSPYIKNDIVIYSKNYIYNLAFIRSVDMSGKSAQIEILMRGVTEDQLKFDL